MKSFFIEFMDKTGFSLEAKEFFLQKFDALSGDTFSCLDALKKEYMIDGENEKVEEELKSLAQKINVHEYTLELMFLICCAKDLREKYAEQNLPDNLFWDLMLDVKIKVDECKAVNGIYGTFVFTWFSWHFLLKRFALGRFQYEMVEFEEEDFTFNGVTIKKGDKIINLHIPATKTPIDRATRLASYKMAYDFYRARGFNVEIMPFICFSWLLYPANKQVFSAGSNSRDFMDDFTIVKVNEKEGFPDAWRIFDTIYDGNPDNLPVKSSMHRNFVEYLKQGKSVGNAVGVFLFDGNAIK